MVEVIFKRLDKGQIIRILQLHQECDISPQHTVMLLFKHLSMQHQDIAVEAGIDKTLIYKALIGIRTPPERLKTVMRQKLGVDIWPYITKSQHK